MEVTLEDIIAIFMALPTHEINFLFVKSEASLSILPPSH